MIRHNVHLRFKSGVTQAQKMSLFDELADLGDHIDGMLDFQHRKNQSPETSLVRGFDDIFWIDFKDAQTRDTYLEDPAHLEVAGRLVAQIEGGVDGVFVCDFEV